jgi:pSer/pThr/pTyr-binding forkhead associated (FHA) protein
VHARLERGDAGWVVTDLESTNGVVVVSADGTETLLERGESAPVTGRFILGKVAMSLVEEGAKA